VNVYLWHGRPALPFHAETPQSVRGATRRAVDDREFGYRPSV
jgi:hypothetical protein